MDERTSEKKDFDEEGWRPPNGSPPLEKNGDRVGTIRTPTGACNLRVPIVIGGTNCLQINHAIFALRCVALRYVKC